MIEYQAQYDAGAGFVDFATWVEDLSDTLDFDALGGSVQIRVRARDGNNPTDISDWSTVVTVQVGRLPADAGSVAVTGTAVGLLYHRRLAASAGALTVTGTPAALLHHRRLAADAGSLVVTGTAAALLRAYVVSADAGTVAVAGSAASLLFHRILSAGSGSVTITGTDATLYGPIATLVPPFTMTITDPARTMAVTDPARTMEIN